MIKIKSGHLFGVNIGWDKKGIEKLFVELFLGFLVILLSHVTNIPKKYVNVKY